MRSIWKLKQRRLDGMPALGRMCVWRWGGVVVVGGSEEVQNKKYQPIIASEVKLMRTPR